MKFRKKHWMVYLAIVLLILVAIAQDVASGADVRLRKYGVETTIDFELYEVDGVDLRVDAVDAGSDCTLRKDGGADTTCTNDFVDEGMSYSLVLTATEMESERLILHIIDSATKVWLDRVVIIETYGNASAEHAFDLDLAEQTVDAVKISGDATTANNFETGTANWLDIYDAATCSVTDLFSDALTSSTIGDKVVADMDANSTQLALLVTEVAEADANLATIVTNTEAYDTDAEYAEAIWGAAVASYSDEADFGGELGGLDANITLILEDTGTTIPAAISTLSAGSLASNEAPTTGTAATVGTQNGAYSGYTLGADDGSVWTITDDDSNPTDVVLQYELGTKVPVSVEARMFWNVAPAGTATLTPQAYNYNSEAYESIGEPLEDESSDQTYEWALSNEHYDPCETNLGEVKIRFIASAQHSSDVVSIDRIVVSAVPAGALTASDIWAYSYPHEYVGGSLGCKLSHLVPLYGKVATADSATSFTLDNGQATNDAYNGMLLMVNDTDTGNHEVRIISDWTSGKVVTVSTAYSFTPAAGDGWKLLAAMTPTEATIWAAGARTLTELDEDNTTIDLDGTTVLSTFDFADANWTAVATDANTAAAGSDPNTFLDMDISDKTTKNTWGWLLNKLKKWSR